jgi:hypothetical protein
MHVTRRARTCRVQSPTLIYYGAQSLDGFCGMGSDGNTHEPRTARRGMRFVRRILVDMYVKLHGLSI